MQWANFPCCPGVNNKEKSRSLRTVNWDLLSQLLRRGEEGGEVKRTGRTEKKARNCPCAKNLVPEDQLKYSN